MRAAVIAIAGLALAGSAGCLRSTTFQCTTDVDCGTGTCETSVGYCSFADSTCASGRRFGELSGTYASDCVGDPGGPDGPPADARVDGPLIDGPMIDAPPAGCLPTYTMLGAHAYRAITTNATWVNQTIACAGEGAYLVIPDGPTELSDVTTLAGTSFYVGISDRTTEGAYVTVLGVTAAYLPWNTGAGQPDDAPPTEDCVLSSALLYSDERCADAHPAVCECEP